MICGVLDPDGVSAGDVARAAGPGAVVRSYGAAVLAWVPGHSVDVTLGGVAVLAYGRVDGVAGPAGVSAGSGLAGLAAAVARRDWPALDAVAADFAAVRYDPGAGTLDLTRDATGSVPLYWGRRGGRVAFGTHPALPVALGAAAGGADIELLRLFLADRDVAGVRTGVEGVFRVVGGRVLTLPARTSYRWFRPERVTPADAPLAAHADAVAGAVTAAVRSRARGRTGLLLSGGHDSGSVAAAAARAGVVLDCVTQRYADGGAEWPVARELAGALGHRWRAVEVRDDVTPEELRELARVAATPVGFAGAQLAVATRAALRDVEVVLDGSGGDTLFSASAVAAGELVRRGRLATAWRTARSQAARQQPPLGAIVRAGVRGALPAAALRLRERGRGRPPWVLGPLPPPRADVARTERQVLLDSLLRLGADHDAELAVRLLAPATYARPLLDRRVVDAALRLPLAARLPVPSVKPVLALGLLGPHAATRTHEVMTARWTRWAAAAGVVMPQLGGTGSLLSGTGILGKLTRSDHRADSIGAIVSAVAAEAWLGVEEESDR